MNANRDPSTILALPANVSEQDALSAFRSRTFSNFSWRLTRGPLQRISLAYLPFGLYHANYEIGRVCHSRFFAIDLVEGALDLLEFPSAIGANDLVPIETCNHISQVLPGDRASPLLREKVLRMILQQGFFRFRHPKLEISPSSIQFHIPYWLGFYGQDGTLRCRVLDAVRRCMEGEKAAALFEHWLAAKS
jgi:hypothetical protein